MTTPAPAAAARPKAGGSQLGRWLSTHRSEATIGGAAAAVAALALYRKHQATTTTSTSSTVPSTASGSDTTGAAAGYDSTTSDLYDALQPMLEQMQNEINTLAQGVAATTPTTSASSSNDGTSSATGSAMPAPVTSTPGAASGPSGPSIQTGPAAGTTIFAAPVETSSGIYPTGYADPITGSWTPTPAGGSPGSIWAPGSGPIDPQTLAQYTLDTGIAAGGGGALKAGAPLGSGYVVGPDGRTAVYTGAGA